MAKGILTQEHYDSIPGLLAEGLDRHQIAERFGVTSATLQVRCCKRRISLRRADLPPIRPRDLTEGEPPVYDWLKGDEMKKLRKRAETQGIAPEQLAGKLLRLICRDDLFDAVLDTGPHTYSNYYKKEEKEVA